jgi:hypothetical protein
MSIGDTARRFCRFLIEDIKDFVANRAQRPGVIVFDEFGEFGAENIRSVLALARSKQWGVVLATQDYANLGDEMTARQIVTNTRTKLLMGTDFPEELAMQGGTRLQLESSIQSDETGPTGMTSGRMQHGLKAEPNKIRSFESGQTYLLRRGKVVSLQISPVVLTQEQRSTIPPEPKVEVEVKPATITQESLPGIEEATSGKQKRRNRPRLGD